MMYYGAYMTNPQYEMTEEDIDAVLRYLQLTRPDQATPEMAISILERMQVRVHMLEHIDPDAIEAVLKELEQN